MRALVICDEVLNFTEASGDLSTKAICLADMSYYSYRLGDFEKSIDTGNLAIEIGKEMKRQDIFLQGLRFIALSQYELKQFDEALNVVRKGLVCVEESILDNDRLQQAWLVTVLLDISSKIAVSDCVYQFSKLLNIPNSTVGKNWPVPPVYLELLFAGATRAQKWDELLFLWKNNKQLFEKNIAHFSNALPGRVLCRLVENRDYAQAYACADNFVSVLAAEILNESLSELQLKQTKNILRYSLQFLVAQSRSSRFLLDIANLIQKSLSEYFEQEILMLEAASIYHRSERKPSALERVDPDIAAALFRLWGCR